RNAVPLNRAPVSTGRCWMGSGGFLFLRLPPVLAAAQAPALPRVGILDGNGVACREGGLDGLIKQLFRRILCPHGANSDVRASFRHGGGRRVPGSGQKKTPAGCPAGVLR